LFYWAYGSRSKIHGFYKIIIFYYWRINFMTGYTVLAGALIFFGLFIYLTWFGTSIKMESQKEEDSNIKINPYDNLPLHRKLIDKKNKQVGFFDLGNHILIVGMVLLVIFVSMNVD
jgi:hypothetical protein